MKLHLFITGVTNSGTGLLRGLVGQHPDTSVLGKEGHHYTRMLPRDRGPRTKRLFALNPDKFCWGVNKLNDAAKAKLRRKFYKRWDENKDVLVEKSPHNMLRMSLMANVFNPARFVVIVRNGYAVAEGLRRRKGHKLAICARQWAEAHRLMFKEFEKVDAILVRYEDLVVSPRETLNEVFAFAALAPFEIDTKTPIKRQNLHGVPYSMESGVDFNAESLLRLSDKDKRVIENEAGDMLKKLGYKEGD